MSTTLHYRPSGLQLDFIGVFSDSVVVHLFLAYDN